MVTPAQNAAVLQQYLDWLAQVMEARLSGKLGSHLMVTALTDPSNIVLPVPLHPEAPLPAFIKQYEMPANAQLLLVMALAPHIDPLFFDRQIAPFIPENGASFPQLGGVKSEQSRVFLPTGETALFLLASDELQQRMMIQALFTPQYLFAAQKVLWLDRVSDGQPAMSGRIVLSQDYVDYFLTGEHILPGFSSDFPAAHITTPLEWSDLVLQPDTMEQVLELKKWIRHKDALLQTNKRLKPGYRALFYGPPGTGKTLTACLLGKRRLPSEDQYDVYRIDLSMIISKYIGETEKNLEKIFTRAEHKHCILFFDEADALFGKRTNIKDAHDKYANQEISYLLQRVENYNGLVILASNFKSNIDAAFSRRFQSIIQFPMPDQADRQKLWEMIFTSVTLNESVKLTEIAARHELSGAAINNVAQYCFLKKMNEAGIVDNIELSDIEEGILREYRKEGKVFR